MTFGMACVHAFGMVCVYVWRGMAWWHENIFCETCVAGMAAGSLYKWWAWRVFVMGMNITLFSPVL